MSIVDGQQVGHTLPYHHTVGNGEVC